MNSLELNVPYLIVFKSLPCLPVKSVFSVRRIKLLFGILVSNTCIHGSDTIFSQLLDLISVILSDVSDSDISEIFEDTDVLPFY